MFMWSAPHCTPTHQPINHHAQLATALQKHNTLCVYESIDLSTLFASDSWLMRCACPLDGELISCAAQHCSVRWAATSCSEGLSCDHHSKIEGGKEYKTTRVRQEAQPLQPEEMDNWQHNSCSGNPNNKLTENKMT